MASLQGRHTDMARRMDDDDEEDFTPLVLPRRSARGKKPMKSPAGGVPVRHRMYLENSDDEEEPLPLPKKQRAAEQASDAVGRQGEARGDGCVVATLTDPEVFDCPICFEHLDVPVFQCQNGHLACSSCCSKLGKKCPSCSSLVGFHRCLGVEKILQSVKIPCHNRKYGCEEMVFLSKRHDPQHKCKCEPCSCPLPDCDFVGSSKNLSLHFSDKHFNLAERFFYKDSILVSLDKQQKYFILQEEAQGSLFILNNGVEPYGNVINVSCIEQSSTNAKFFYELVAMNAISSVTLKSWTKFAPAWVEHTPLERFLVVPKEFVGSNGKLKLELRIFSL